ncbi:hypothetical protein JAAARDRAFT_163427 [Jaapia argillacea MUCL 33604]|uniref:FAD dependent oxidoreductase domain-containing protein n=1 Tax=Jaapia argillacea MUCL 33604 TaxID=933084 RepID=A0A067P9M7_9AGAM|nr:hypothetical protein JAAARDRAFT_163427 [Jaapia argillacea MUCL 33604]
MASPASNDASVLIVGAGTFGLSTSFHLAKRGYKNVTCLDPWNVPSRSSAGWDISKIARTEYANPIYTRIAHESLDAWRDLEPFASAKLFHQTGWLYMKPHDVPPAVASRFETALQQTKLVGDISQVEYLPDENAIKIKCPLISGDLNGWSGIFNGNAGWVEAKRSMEVLVEECSRLGVRFISGPAGTMKSLLRGEHDNEVLGVVAQDGTEHLADLVILATGAWSESLLNFEGQLFSGAYNLCHIQLTPEEAEKYASLPVLNAPTRGYCFPPTKDGIFKIASLGYTNTNYVDLPAHPQFRVSVPRDRAFNPTDTLSEESIAECRKIAQACLPELGDRDLCYSAMCWDTESFDFNWIISPHPSSTRLFIATAGSGHTFKNLPVVGKYVADCVEGNLPSDLREAWRWRPDRVRDFPPLERVDIKSMHGWRHDGKSETDV